MSCTGSCDGHTFGCTACTCVCVSSCRQTHTLCIHPYGSAGIMAYIYTKRLPANFTVARQEMMSTGPFEIGQIIDRLTHMAREIGVRANACCSRVRPLGDMFSTSFKSSGCALSTDSLCTCLCAVRPYAPPTRKYDTHAGGGGGGGVRYAPLPPVNKHKPKGVCDAIPIQ